MPTLFLAAVMLALVTTPATAAINLHDASGTGVRVLRGFAGKPDSHGVLRREDVQLPPFEAAVYYSSKWWPAGGNRVFPTVVDRITELPEGGLFLLLKLATDDYLAILPMAGRQSYSWLAAADGQLELRSGTHGWAAVNGDLPLLAFSRAASPYRAIFDVWKAALESGQLEAGGRLREEKAYTEAFRYLGWCSWEQYKRNITGKVLLDAIDGIEKSGLPVRYVLIDAGHFDHQSLAPDTKKFPHGYRPLTARRRDRGIRWIGIWYAFLGDHHGVKAPGNLGPLTADMLTSANGVLLPKPAPAVARRFYDSLFRYARRDDLDFLKVDFMVDALPLYAGLRTSKPPTLGGLPKNTHDAVANPYAASAILVRAYEAVVEVQLPGPINCNWHNAVSLFHSRYSAVGRCSEDYTAGNLRRAKGHLYHSFAAIPWLGQIAWGDHDMFHSSDKFAGRIMAASKALSGGPVYLSDAPEDFVPEVIRPLADDDGLLYRPLAPAAPVDDDLFWAPGQGTLFRVIAPLANRSAALAVYNLDGGVSEDEQELRATISPAHYTQASAMIQPYPGKWKLPPEGLLLYDVYERSARKLSSPVEVSIRGFGDRLFQMTPIASGWAVIGNPEKYLPAAAVAANLKGDSVEIRAHEAGPVVVWSSRGKPQSPGLEFRPLSGNLYETDLPARTVRITR